MTAEKNVKDMTDTELLETYYYVSEKCATRSNVNDATLFSSLASVYSTELIRRENLKANRAMKRWTIAIGVMTGIILAATLINALTFSFA